MPKAGGLELYSGKSDVTRRIKSAHTLSAVKLCYEVVRMTSPFTSLGHYMGSYQLSSNEGRNLIELIESLTFWPCANFETFFLDFDNL